MIALWFAYIAAVPRHESIQVHLVAWPRLNQEETTSARSDSIKQRTNSARLVIFI